MNLKTYPPGSTLTRPLIKRKSIITWLPLFKNLAIEEDNNTIIESLVQQTVVFLERNPSLIDRFQREIATSPAGQYYYFEQSVNMDRLNNYYGDGLRFYLRAKNDNEAFVFSNSIQVLRYWLTNNSELLENAMAELAAITVNSSYPSHIYARYIAARLYYAHSKGEAIDKIMAEAARYHSAFLSRNGSNNPDFELIMTEALILTNHYPEANDYIKKGKSRLTPFKKGHDHENPFGPWEKMVNSKRNTTLKVIMPPSKNRCKYCLSFLSSYQTIFCHIKFTGRLQNKADKP